MVQADPSKRITAQRLQGEYVLSEAWNSMRHGYSATRKSFLRLDIRAILVSLLTYKYAISIQMTGSRTRVLSSLGPPQADSSIS